MKRNENYPIQGFYFSEYIKYFSFVIDYCDPDSLASNFPGEKRKCKTKKESENLIRNLKIDFLNINSYFDQNEFKTDSIKKVLNYDDLYVKANISHRRVFKIVNTKVEMKDSWIDFSPGVSRDAYELKLSKSDDLPY